MAAIGAVARRRDEALTFCSMLRTRPISNSTVTIDRSVTVHRLELNSFGVIRQVGSETVAGSLAAEQLNFTEGALALANGTLCGIVARAGQRRLRFNPGLGHVKKFPG
jgi:hypothetical protein